MSGEDIIQQRGAALESQFFAAVDAKLMADLQAELKKSQDTQELSRLSGIQDAAVLEAIVSAGVSPSAFPAFRLFPLVAIAWADGMLDGNERDVVVAAAEQHSVGKDTPSGAVLATWLENQPSPALFSAWEAFTKALVAKLTPEEAQSVKTSIVNEVKAVAKASGGVLGYAAISKGENEILNRVINALTR
ncbi:MAG: hypothetical protein SGI77_09830 [Pirellulaceae bacterium]|nr:hypothetical protein [Pirellulaceae bacterium]